MEEEKFDWSAANKFQFLIGSLEAEDGFDGRTVVGVKFQFLIGSLEAVD